MKKPASVYIEKLPSLCSWLFLVLPILCIQIFPAFVAVFFILFSLYWLIKSLGYSFFLIKSFHHFRKHEKIQWSQHLHAGASQVIADERIQHFTEMSQLRPISEKDITEVFHIVFITTYKEPYEVLADSCHGLAQSNIDTEKLFIVLAGEEKDELQAIQNYFRLRIHFYPTLPHFIYTIHPKNTLGEIPGKGSNITYSAKIAVPYIVHTYNKKPEYGIVTTLDADHIVHSDYFALLTYTFLRTPNNQHYSFQPLPFLYNNYWKVPLFVRLIALSSTFWHLIESSRKGKLRTFSAYAQPLQALMDMHYWSNTTIVEDGHQFWRSYMHFNSEYKVIPLYIPIYQDAVEKATYKDTLKAQYVQLRRWAHGAEDVGYLGEKLLHQKNIPFWKTVSYFFSLLESHVMWATAPLLLLFSSIIFDLFNPRFLTSPIYFQFSAILNTYYSIAIIGIVISISMSFLLLPKPPEQKTLGRKIYLYCTIVLQWFLLPITTILFSAIPALEAQTRILFGKKVHFVVTEKRR